MPKVYIKTFGCQMNNYDSERIAGILEKRMNFAKTACVDDADLILLNTCSVREKAEQKVFSELGRLKRVKIKRPEVIIGVCGCIAQLHGSNLIKRAPYIDLVLGTNTVDKLPILLAKAMEKRRSVVNTHWEEDPFKGYSIEDIQRESAVKAFVNIMTGCSNFCTYCVVPFTRGREKSRISRHILEEITFLAKKGYKEITLLGQNVNSFGNDLSGEPDFPELLSLVNDIEGIDRIRFVTSHPKDLTEKLMSAIFSLNKVCEHIHLPVQSGSDRILYAMNRGYTASDYIKKVDNLKKIVPDIAFSTDIIVGFPGETDKDFEQTLSIVKNIEYELIYLFKYSNRPETKASRLKDVVPDNVVNERFEVISSLQRQIMLKNNKEMEKTVQAVLVEGRSKKDKTELSGRTRTNKTVNFSGEADRLLGKIVDIFITKGSVHHLKGRLYAAP